jgi:hypothetical protein
MIFQTLKIAPLALASTYTQNTPMDLKTALSTKNLKQKALKLFRSAKFWTLVAITLAILGQFGPALLASGAIVMSLMQNFLSGNLDNACAPEDSKTLAGMQSFVGKGDGTGNRLAFNAEEEILVSGYQIGPLGYGYYVAGNLVDDE